MPITVRDRREDMGWMQKELAQKANVSVSTVWRAENGVPIRRLLAKRIARALEIPLEQLDIRISDIPNVSDRVDHNHSMGEQ